MSLINEETKNNGVYKANPVYHDMLEISGRWLESDGAPVLTLRSVMKFHFSGTGIRIFFWKDTAPGRYSVYLDQNFMMEVDIQAVQKERADLLVAENIPMGQHTMTIVGKEGRAVFEGFMVYGKGWNKGPAGWISLIPISGVTTREVDYVTVNVNTQKLSPGVFGDVLKFTSNGGEALVPVFIEVTLNNAPKLIDVFRYSSGKDYLFTTNVQDDEQMITSRLYKKDGVAFRLFPPGTPGTVEFFGWYSPVRGSHYYSPNKSDGGKIGIDYILQGSIGQIATSRIRQTRELYRWFDPSTGFYFYTTDRKGNGIEKKGYRFDGIAGYVR
ncbi:MAG: hypothetical protein PHN75_04880 [Syntrophales bacterium]|nr:hypothetical protein [Syntrophales bacterium]